MKQGTKELPGSGVARIERVKVDDLTLDPANVRRHPVRNLDAIKGSLARFGQQKPIVVGAGNVVIAGNGTLLAARELGWVDVAIVRSPLVGSEATAFAIADNRTSELAEWDDDELAKQLAAITVDDKALAASTGFSEVELARLVGAVVDPAVTWVGMPEFANRDLTSFSHVTVHFTCAADLEDFANRIGQTLTERTNSIWHPFRPLTDDDRYANKRYADEPAISDLRDK